MEPGKDPRDLTALCCMRLAEMEHRVPGSIERVCAKCGEVVSISPSSQRLLRDIGEAKVLITCTHCMETAVIERFDLVPGSMEEIRAWRLATMLAKSRN